MIRQGARRHLGRWLIGLFFIAQICSVGQLLGEHTEHVTESQLILSHATLAGNISYGHRHHEGDADGVIQHHELQDLNGAPACLVVGSETAFAHIATTAYVPDALNESDPVPLQRPPRRFLSV